MTPQLYDHNVAFDGTVLSDVQRDVLWHRKSEPAFSGEAVNGYKWDTKEDGTWVSAVSGIPLFSTEMKYDRCKIIACYITLINHLRTMYEISNLTHANNTNAAVLSGTGWPTFSSPIDVNHFGEEE